VLTSVRSRLPAVTRWLVPSVIAACVGALVAGIVDGRRADGWFAVATTAGFVVLIALPVLLAASLIVRGLVVAWQPRRIVESLLEARGSAPRLAGWVGVVWLGTLALAWAMFQGTWLLASWTAFKPLSIGFLAPLLGVGTVLGIVLLSRPAAMLFTWLARKLDARWQRIGPGTLLGPRTIGVGAVVTAIAAVCLIWRLLVTRRLGDVELGFLLAPTSGIIATILVHAAWRGSIRVRAIAGGLVGATTVAAIVLAVHAATHLPALALEIWADAGLARRSIERVFELEAIRGDVSIEQFRPAERPGAPHPDIVLVTMDGVRADRTPPYGGPAQMPALRELGQRGAVFAWAFAPSNSTRHSIPSMATGIAPNRIQGRASTWALRLDPRHVLLAERLRAGGYETAGFLCCDEYWSERGRTGWPRGLEHLVIEQDGRTLARAARAWIEHRERTPGNRPLFVWIHLLDPVGSGPQGRTDDERRRLYDHSLAAADALLVEVFGAFAQRAPERVPLSIITANHGQGLGEHGQPYHATDLYNSQIHVPFVIAGPGIKAQRIPETVSLTDLMPTIVELAGFEPPRGVDGRSLADLATARRSGETASGTAFAMMLADRSRPETTGASAIVRGGWKLIDSGTSVELYDLKNDPAERYNLFGQRPQIVVELKALLAARVRAAQRPPF